MRRVDRLAAALGILAVALASCGLAGFGRTTDELPPDAPQPIGPIVQIGRGEGDGFTWRYSVYESTMGTCTRLETDGALAGGANESCGVTIGLGEGDGPLTVGGVGTGPDIPTMIEGFASADVAEVWIETDGDPVAATLMALGPVDLEGQVYVAFVPPGQDVGDAVAYDAAGEEIGREPVDVPDLS
jgi:hypothetical protein